MGKLNVGITMLMVGVGDGGLVGAGADVLVGASVGIMGVGGAAITASATGMQVAVVILPEIHP